MFAVSVYLVVTALSVAPGQGEVVPASRDYASVDAIPELEDEEVREAPVAPPPSPTVTADEALSDEAPGEEMPGDDALDYDPRRDSPEAVEARGWVRSGVVSLVVGSVLTIGGVILSQTDPCSFEAGNGCQEAARLRASLAMAVPGGILIGSGAAMLAVGKVRQRRLAASLQAARGRLGVGVVVRF